MISSQSSLVLSQPSTETPPSSSFKDGKFTNQHTAFSTNLKDMWNTAKAYFRDQRQAAEPSAPIPVNSLTTEDLNGDQQDTVYRLSHSTMLIKIDNKIVLTDPVFSDRASPVQWLGPKRFHQPAISIDTLPRVDVVVISHNHYDHLDKHSIKQLADKVDHFLVPLKVGNDLIKWGVPSEKVTELDWWQEKQVKGITFAATPTQHFSGRGLFDRDKTLWASWVILGSNSRLFFSGDSGYFPGFKEIGERYGPFDVTMIETGAYNTNWQDIHMMPEQSLQAHKDLQGQAMFPIHNSTFDLSLHDWHEPLERIHSLAQSHNVTLLTPIFGEAIIINNINPQQIGSSNMWWRKLEKATLQQKYNGLEQQLLTRQ